MLGLDDAYVLRTLRVLEISLIVAAILGIVAVVFPNLLGRWFAACESTLSRFAETSRSFPLTIGSSEAHQCVREFPKPSKT